jgi:hypothetical protein
MLTSYFPSLKPKYWLLILFHPLFMHETRLVGLNLMLKPSGSLLVVIW